MSIFKMIYKTVVMIEVAVIVMMFTLIGVPRFINVEPRIVLSGSMEPKILTGSIAYIDHNVKSEDIEVGDVIAFNIGDEKTVIHRVVSINENESQFTTKGDANEEEDFSPVPFENYKGQVKFSIPFLGYLVEKLKDIKVMLIIALVFVSHLFIDELLKEEEEETDEQKI